MTFEPKKFDQIYEEMVSETRKLLPEANADFAVGSVLRTMYESFAYEIAVLEEQMQQVYLSAFVDTATGTQLDMLVAILGIKRGLPDFAEGVVTFNRDTSTEDIEIPVGTLVTTEDTEKSPKKAYKTIEPKTFPGNQKEIDVKVQALDRGEENIVQAEAIVVMPQPVPGVKSVVNRATTQFTGKRQETDYELRQRAKSILISSGKASVIAIENALLILPGVKQVKIKERFDQKEYGVIDIFVDGIDFSDRSQVQYLYGQIDRVKAAGVFFTLQAAINIEVDGMFEVEIDSTLKLSNVERKSLENRIQLAISNYINALKMGEPLLFNQLMRIILSIPGVNNLEEFAIATPSRTYTSSDKKVTIGESEKFHAHQIGVTTVKPLPLNVQIQLKSPGKLDSAKYQDLQNSLASYFNNLKIGESFSQTAIAEIIKVPNSDLKVFAQSWSSFVKSSDPGRINVSFVEQAQLDKNIFAYDTILKLIGGLRFTSNGSITSSDRAQIKYKITERIAIYIEKLNPQEDIYLLKLQKAAQGEDDTWTIEPIKNGDFWTEPNNQSNPDYSEIEDHKIKVDEFATFESEKRNLYITHRIETVEIKITKLQLKLIVLVAKQPTIVIDSPLSPPSQITQNTLSPEEINNIKEIVDQSIQQALFFDIERAKQEIPKAVITVIQEFPRPKPGKNLSYEQLSTIILSSLDKPAIKAVLQGQATYEIDQLVISATSIDGRKQNSTGEDIHIRSFEIADIQTPTPDIITIIN